MNYIQKNYLGLHDFAEHFQLSEEELHELEQEINAKNCRSYRKKKRRF